MDHTSHSEQIRNTLLCHAMDTILEHFGAFCCILVHLGAPHVQPHGPSMTCTKRPFTPEMGHISHSGQIRNTLLCHAMDTILMRFGAFWCILVHLMCNPMTPP